MVIDTEDHRSSLLISEENVFEKPRVYSNKGKIYSVEGVIRSLKVKYKSLCFNFSHVLWEVLVTRKMKYVNVQ